MDRKSRISLVLLLFNLTFFISNDIAKQPWWTLFNLIAAIWMAFIFVMQERK